MTYFRIYYFRPRQLTKNIVFSDVFYIHRASVWGVKIQDGYIVTGSMDGTIAVIDAETLEIKKHFMAHENEWGSKFCLRNIIYSYGHSLTYGY